MHLGLLNGMCIYVALVLLFGHCWWPWTFCSPWAGWTPQCIWMLQVLWVEGTTQARAPHYYPTLLKPMNYDHDGCNHANVNVYVLLSASCFLYSQNLAKVVACETDAQFRPKRRETGLCKPSIFLGLPQTHSSVLPECLAINLLIGLWWGTIDCNKKDSKDLWDWLVLIRDIWELHGKDIACCQPYLPGSFNCPPQNPAEKISSGFKKHGSS